MNRDWIDEEKQQRDDGQTLALSQSQHAAVNARYPGCTLECCRECGEPTGAAGKGEDSLYRDDGSGPYCGPCFDLLEEKTEPMNQPQKKLVDELAAALRALLRAFEIGPPVAYQTFDTARAALARYDAERATISQNDLDAATTNW